MVGRVIGKGGETIKAMQREFQANIQIDQTSLPMKITISGQPASVERAYGVVAEIVAGGNPYIGGSVGHAGIVILLVPFGDNSEPPASSSPVCCTSITEAQMSCYLHISATQHVSICLLCLCPHFACCIDSSSSCAFQAAICLTICKLLLLSCLQCKEHHEALPQELHLDMAPPPHMALLLSTHQPSQHMAVTQVTPQQQQPPPIQAMEVATLRPVLTAATLRSQQLPMVVKHRTVVVVLVGMIPMVHRVSSHTAVPVAMVSRVLSPVLSQQQEGAAASGQSCRTMRAGLITTTRSPASASGTGQLTCEQQQQQHWLLSAASWCASTGQAKLSAVVPGACNASPT